MTALGILWYVLVAVLLIGYFVLDGFDLGAGVLYPFVAKTDEEKRQLVHEIGPVWDGNEVWLLTAGGALFAAFAPAYAASFSGFYLAIMLVLFGLILRAASVEFRAHGERPTRLRDALFFVGSLLPALLFGVAVGNVVEGIPLDVNGDYTGGFFALLNPFALLVVLVAATLFPNLVPATESVFSLTVGNSASSDTALAAMKVIACIGVPVMLVYHVIVYRTFRGRL